MQEVSVFENLVPLNDDVSFLEQYSINGAYSIASSDFKSGVWNFGKAADDSTKGRMRCLIPVHAGMGISFTVSNYAIYFGVLNLERNTYVQTIGWRESSGYEAILQDGYLVVNIKNKEDDSIAINPSQWDGTAIVFTSSFHGKGALASGSDLNLVFEDGHYAIASTRNYEHLPPELENRFAILEVFHITDHYICQRVSSIVHPICAYFRYTENGSFENVSWVDKSPRSLEKQYVAFGDSITRGSVWNAESHKSENWHQAPYKWRIPTRIARAIGSEDSFVNAAIGGIGYITSVEVGGIQKNLVDVIKAYDFTNVEVVTIGGGPNDITQKLGFSDAERNDGTICGAIREIIEYMRANYPKVQLIFIQSTPFAGYTNGQPNNVWTTRGNNGQYWTLDEFDAEVSKLCYDCHVGYVNWYGCPYVNNWNVYNIGYANNVGPYYTHPIEDFDYCILGDYLAGKISSMVFNEPETKYDVKLYRYDDLDQGKVYNVHTYTGFGKTLDPVVDHETNASFSSILIPIKKGDVITLRTTGSLLNGRPYAIVKSNYLIDYIYTDNAFFCGTIEVAQSGFLAVNVVSTYASKFFCEVKTPLIDEVRESMVVNALPVQTDQQNFLAYDPMNVCHVLKKDASLGSMLHHWAIIGASFDSGEFNFRVANNEHMSEIDWYEYSCWEAFRKMNGIPDLYMYCNGGQNAKDWISLKSGDHFLGVTTDALTDGDTRTTITVNGQSVAAVDYGLAFYQNREFLFTASDGKWHAIDTVSNAWINCYGAISRSYAYNSDSEEILWYWDQPNGVVGRSGIGLGGGCWWKMRQDHQNGKTRQVFVVNLGSNDINNNYPHNDDWTEKQNYDATKFYTCGTIADIGEYDYATDTDTVPSGKTAGVVPGVVNSYAAYIGAILNRILAIQPDAIIFLCTIRNGFCENEFVLPAETAPAKVQNRMAVWAQYNDVLKSIAAMDRYKNNVYILDNAEFGPNYSCSPMRNMIVGYHPNAVGYQYIAQYWNTLVDYTVQTNYTKMRQSMFIGTGRQYSAYISG